MDEILVKKTLSGDKAAFNQLVTKYQTQVYGLAFRTLKIWRKKHSSALTFRCINFVSRQNSATGCTELHRIFAVDGYKKR